MAKATPRTSVSELPLCFFLGAGRSSSSSPRRGPALAAGLPVTAADLPAPLAAGLVVTAAAFPFLAGASSASSGSSGSSTTKRYLHLGQSILRPISFGSRIGTLASQLGQGTLKLVRVAMGALRYNPRGSSRPRGR